MWLKGVSAPLMVYAEALAGEGFDTVEALRCLTEKDMVELGIKLGHRRMLGAAIKGLGAPLAPPEAEPGMSEEEEDVEGPGHSAAKPPSYDAVVSPVLSPSDSNERRRLRKVRFAKSPAGETSPLQEEVLRSHVSS